MVNKAPQMIRIEWGRKLWRNQDLAQEPFFCWSALIRKTYFVMLATWSFKKIRSWDSTSICKIGLMCSNSLGLVRTLLHYQPLCLRLLTQQTIHYNLKAIKTWLSYLHHVCKACFCLSMYARFPNDIPYWEHAEGEHQRS